MPSKDRQTCSECGARAPSNAVQCDLCGAELPSDTKSSQERTPEHPDASAAPGVRPVPAEASLPRGRDGENDEASKAEDNTGKKQTSPGLQLAMVVGVAVMLVVALFFITNLSKELSAPVNPVPAEEEGLATRSEGPGEPTESIFDRLEADESDLPPGIAPVVDSLRTVIAEGEGDAVDEARRQKIDMLIGAGRMDHAAVEQRRLAEQVDTPDAWRRTGDLFYEWMDRMNAGPEKVEVAQAAIAAYDRVLAEQPDDLDVRADLATALLETDDPMRGVEEIQLVLEEDPDHLQARFNYGIMLAMIGRTEASIEQFEHAQRIVGEDSPFYRQAEQIIAELRDSGDAMPGPEGLTP